MIRNRQSRPGCVLRSIACGVLAFSANPSVGAATAPAPTAFPADFTEHRFSTEHGLPQTWARALAQTPDGYLWVGTLFGLARFDGVRFVTFDHASTPALLRDAINALAVDARDGALWVGSEGGLLRHDGFQWLRIWPADPRPAAIHYVAPDPQGGVWIETNHESFSRFDRFGSAVETRRLPPGTGLESLKIVQPCGRHLLVGDDRQLHLLGESTAGTTAVALPLPELLIRRILVGPDGNLSVVGERSVWRGKWTGTSVAWARVDGLPERSPETQPDLILGADRFPWVHCREAGTWEIDDTRARLVLPRPLRADDQPTVACLDREGTRWIGTRAGLIQHVPRRLAIVGTADGQPGGDMQSIHEGPGGTIWIGSAGGLLSVQGREIRTVPLPAALPSSFAHRVLATRDGSVWISNNGLWRRDPGGAWHPMFADHVTQFIRALYEEPDGTVWISDNQFVHRVQDGVREAILPTSVPPRDVRAFLRGQDGALWMGLYGGGLLRWQNGRVETWQTDKGEFNNRMWAIHEDARGVLWLGTQNGLNRFANGRFFTFTLEHGLGENVVNHVLEDDTGHLWLGGLRGIYRVDRAELDAIAEGRGTPARCVAFGEPDGMPTAETNGEYEPSACRGRDGRLWFPTPRGAVVIDPRQTPVNDVPPQAILERVTADEETLLANLPGLSLAATPDHPLRLPPGRARVLELRFSAPSFIGADRTRFRYRLLGYDSAWRAATSDRVAYYTNLRPGDYRFEVTAANSHGAWQPTPAVFAFSLAPLFTQTAWYPASIAAAALLLGTGAFAWRLGWQKRTLRAEHAAALAEERARIARDLHDDLGTALTGVAFELDVLDRRPAPDLPDRLRAAARHVRTLANRMREVVWTANPQCDSVPSLALFLEQQAVPLLRSAGVNARLDFPDPLPPFPLDANSRHQLLLGVREALNNVIRHAGATEATLRISALPSRLHIEVEDNGRGFDPRLASDTGHAMGTRTGLLNLRTRLERLGGSFRCESTPGNGTRAIFDLPLHAP